jgi:hypothetical protein
MHSLFAVESDITVNLCMMNEMTTTIVGQMNEV